MESYINSLKSISDVNEYRNIINKQCDERIEVIETVKRANELSGKNFGYIKEGFEALSPELFKTSDGKKLINKYTSIIKESNNLSSMHKINEAVRKAGKDTDPYLLARSLSDLDWEINKKTIGEDVKKLGNVLAEAYIIVGKNDAEKLLPKENESLYKAISYIAENKLTKSNVTEHIDAIKIIKDNISQKENVENVFESKNLDSLASQLLEEFNKKYSDALSEEESSVLKEVACSTNREDVFNKYKKSCIEKISEAKRSFEEKGDSKSSERLSSVIEQVNNKQYCLESVGEDICNLIEISNIFE